MVCVVFISSGRLTKPLQSYMSKGEFMLAREHVRYGQDNPTDAERYVCRDFEQPCANCAAGRRLQRGLERFPINLVHTRWL